MIQQTDSQVLGRLLELEGSRLSAANARLILSVDFSPEDRERLEELGRKSGEEELDEREKQEYASFVRVIDLLANLQSRARIALRKLGKTRLNVE